MRSRLGGNFVDPKDTYALSGDVIAELGYAFGDATWAALVFLFEDADGGHEYLVRVIRTRDGKTTADKDAGTFTNGKALVKFVRRLASERFEDYTPVVDTLDKLKDRIAGSVVPWCYNEAGPNDKTGGRPDDELGKHACPTCPYESTCASVTITNKFVAPIELPASAFSEQEQESLLIERLRKKMREKYGDSE